MSTTNSTSPPQHSNNTLADSTATLPSDSENYSPSSNSEEPSAINASESASPPSSSSPVILYQPPTIWSLLRGAAINVFLPFVNGLMLGLGELLAHEAAFRLGWSGTKVSRCGMASAVRAGMKPLLVLEVETPHKFMLTPVPTDISIT